MEGLFSRSNNPYIYPTSILHLCDEDLFDENQSNIYRKSIEDAHIYQITFLSEPVGSKSQSPASIFMVPKPNSKILAPSCLHGNREAKTIYF